MSQARPAQSWAKPIVWGVAIGIFQACSPLAFRWLTPVVVWSLSVASVFIVLAALAMKPAPWLVVIALVAHGIKDTWQHRTQFVRNTRWWPPFCLVVDLVAAALIAIRLLSRS